MGFDYFVDLGHQAEGFFQGNGLMYTLPLREALWTAAAKLPQGEPSPATWCELSQPSTYPCSSFAEFPAASQASQHKEADLKWKKFLRIAAITVIPGGLAIAGGVMVVKKIRSKREEKEKARLDLAKQGQEGAEKEERGSPACRGDGQSKI